MDTLWQLLQMRWKSAFPLPSGKDCAWLTTANDKQAIDHRLRM